MPDSNCDFSEQPYRVKKADVVEVYVQGIQGVQGLRGEKGEKGDKGDKGEDGSAFIQEITEAEIKALFEKE
jgi:hypothetical protein